MLLQDNQSVVVVVLLLFPPGPSPMLKHKQDAQTCKQSVLIHLYLLTIYLSLMHVLLLFHPSLAPPSQSSVWIQSLEHL